MSSSSSCPDDADEVAESYCLDRLPPEEVEEFEEHLLLCPECIRRVEESEEFVEALRAWSARRPDAGPDQ